LSVSRRVKKLATAVVVGGLIAIFLLDILTVLLCNRYEKRFPIPAEDFSFAGTGAGNRVHFLNTDNSDCILLESNGRFALIDSGWGSNNPNPKSSRKGYEARILEYIKRVAADESGRVTLEFAQITHLHFDHAGGFPLILADEAITVKTVYMRTLPEAQQFAHEVESWDVDEIRRRILDVAARRGFPVEGNPPAQPFAFGAMTLQFLNVAQQPGALLRGENDNSIVTLVALGGTRGLLTADITNLHGLERRIATQVGQVDFIKLAHHGYAGSNSAAMLRRLKPKLGIVTNGLGQIYPNVKWNLTMVSRTALASTVRENGLILHLEPGGKLRLTGDLHKN
jgi:beta-lactamase superfamily II metal-dependent hydrolase